MSRNTVDERHYWNKMWNSFINKAVHIIVSRRILFDDRAKKGRNKNTKSFHFPDVDEYYETSSTIKRATRGNEESENQVYYLDIFVDEVFEVKPDTSKARGTGLLSRKMANQTKEYKKRYILERWVIQKADKRTGMSHTLNKMIYQKATILMRSLYSYLLLLPCYKLYRRNQRNRNLLTKLKFVFYRASDAAIHENEVDTVTRELHQRYRFSSVVTSVCQLSIFVEYSKNTRFDSLEQQTLIDSGMIRKDILSEFEEDSGEINEEESMPIVSSFDPDNEEQGGERYGPSPSRPVPTGSGRGKRTGRRSSSSRRQQKAGSVPNTYGNRRRSGTYRGGTGTSYDDNVVGSPPFARFVGSIENHPHNLYGTSFEKRAPFGILRKPSIETGTPKLPFSPFNSPPLHSYSSSTTSEHFSTTPTPPKYPSYGGREDSGESTTNNNNRSVGTEKVLGDNNKPKKKETLKPPTEPNHLVSAFTPPDPDGFEALQGLARGGKTGLSSNRDGQQGKGGPMMTGLGRGGGRPLLPPMIMDFKLGASSTTPGTPKEFSGDEGSGLAFADDDGHHEESDEEKSEYHELVGGLLNKIENAPILAAFYNDGGDVKTERLTDVLNTLSKLERGKKMMMMMK